MKKLTYEFINKEFKKEGYKLLSNKYINNSIYLYSICSEGHHYKCTYDSFQQGRRCPICKGNKKKTYKEVENIINSTGEKLLSRTYANSKTKLKVLCKNNHEYYIILSDFKQGVRCKRCYDENKRYQNFSKGGVKKNNVALYETYAKQLCKYHKIKKGYKDGFEVIMVVCTKCKKFYIPSYTSVSNRLQSIRGDFTSENNFYCSDGCKNSCKLFNFSPDKQIDPESKLYILKSEQQTTRNCQTDHLKRLQLDEFGYNYCEKCGQEVNIVELHHTLEVAKFGLEAVNSAGHLLVCNDCHKEFNKMCK